MKAGKTEITICLGSSCFARGNKRAVNVIQAYIKQNELETKVHFKGNHCFGKCNRGPVLQVNDHIYEQVAIEKLPEILDRELGRLKEQNV
ncbi:MAG TPA: NAD(P)H-dependent oxidoreductase subunit E [Bacteroidales bacterium]|nr:NAD(P)H-dependent oxidoreductase subunit E [Bacteroidales bacterium]